MPRLFSILGLPRALLWLALLLLAGCDGSDRLALGTETNEPYYRQGDQLKRQGRYQEALAAYLKVIEKRNEDAPESHLEAGLIYQQYLKDPIYAIYHFRKYLELEPNSRQADLVRQRIDAALRDFARTLPARPLEDQTLRFDLMSRIDELQKQNLELKEEVARLNRGATDPGGDSGVIMIPVPASAPPPAVTRGSLFNPPASSATAARPAQPSERPAAPSAKPPPAAGRTHVVAEGETLSKIALRYYGSRAKWPAILDANRDVLKNENSVRAGMTLRIP
jgi:tetratricopeptide (TPR) repeat protein